MYINSMTNINQYVFMKRLKCSQTTTQSYNRTVVEKILQKQMLLLLLYSLNVQGKFNQVHC